MLSALSLSRMEREGLQEVLLKIRFENSKGRHYICLDRPDYTSYPDEKEVILQAGLKAQVIDYTDVNGDERTDFSLYISDKMVQREKKKRTLDYALPVMIYLADRLCASILNLFLENM